MKLNEIIYAILELIRGGLFVDDDKFDFRLIEAFVHSKRAEYVQQLSDSGKLIPEHFYQYIDINGKILISNPVEDEKIYKLSNVPAIVFSRHGAMISEIVSANSIYGGYSRNNLPYKYLTPQAFKYSGNGRFNANMIFATYANGELLLKSKGDLLPTLTLFLAKVVLEDPTHSPTFNDETDDYPISMQAFEYIKNAVIGIDVKVFVAGRGDKINDSVGEEQ